MSFQVHALSGVPFAPLFALTDDALAARGARRVVADAPDSYPCRVSLEDAAVGETLLLVNHEHQPAASPYRSRHAIYVRAGAERAEPAAGSVPSVLRRRLLAVRAFDALGMMRDADVVDGGAVDAVLERMLAPASTHYLHVHYAKPGCFAALVARQR